MEDSLADLTLTPSTRDESILTPYLPVELLDQIWLATILCTGPRIVDIRSESKMDGLTSSCRIPPLLHTCSRSRKLALQRWKLCFPTLDESGNLAAKVFFDYSQDTLFFTQEFVDISQFALMVSKEERMKIKSVAFDLTVVATLFNDLGTLTFGRAIICELHENVRLVFVLRDGKADEQAWAREGKMISFFPAKEPREVTDSKTKEIKFLELLSWNSGTSVTRGVPKFKFVGIRVVEMGSEAWDLRSLEIEEGEKPEQRWWKTGWKIWYQNGARS